MVYHIARVRHACEIRFNKNNVENYDGTHFVLDSEDERVIDFLATERNKFISHLYRTIGEPRWVLLPHFGRGMCSKIEFKNELSHNYSKEIYNYVWFDSRSLQYLDGRTIDRRSSVYSESEQCILQRIKPLPVELENSKILFFSTKTQCYLFIILQEHYAFTEYDSGNSRLITSCAVHEQLKKLNQSHTWTLDKESSTRWHFELSVLERYIVL